MARPIKHGLDYFPFDIDLFSDEKIVAIAGEFGIKGEIATIKLLCAVYRNGYFVEWTEMLKFKLLKELPGISADLLDQIVRRLVKWDFFDKDLFDSASILTSRGIQRRYQSISAKMHRKNAVTQYCLLDAPPRPALTPAKPSQRKPKAPGQSPAPVAETCPPAAVRPKEAPVALDESIAAMLSDTQWNEPVCMRYRLHPQQFKQKVAYFRLHCLNLEKRQHDNVADAKRHFCTLLSQGKLDDYNPPTTNADTAPDYTYSGGFGGRDT